jgi:hypothetical protein
MLGFLQTSHNSLCFADQRRRRSASCAVYRSFLLLINRISRRTLYLKRWNGDNWQGRVSRRLDGFLGIYIVVCCSKERHWPPDKFHSILSWDAIRQSDWLHLFLSTMLLRRKGGDAIIHGAMEVSDYLWYILVRDWSNFLCVSILYVLLNTSPNSSFSLAFSSGWIDISIWKHNLDELTPLDG